MTPLKTPFPWFGGKSRVAALVWRYFGNVKNYVEPFFGSGAVLLGRPEPFYGPETVNDKDGFVSNFWRAVKADSEKVAFYADWPVNENDLHARHAWLVGIRDDFCARLEGDPEYFDARVAGWWVWGMACWIGGGFCSGKGPWQSVQDEDGTRRLVRLETAGQGVQRKLVHLGDAGRGVQRKLVHLGNAGRGVKRQLVHLGNAGRGVRRNLVLQAYMECLSGRLKDTRVACGDWSRVVGPSVTIKHGVTGVFLDPPYGSAASRDNNLYSEESLSVSSEAREWAIANGNNPKLRIALCGYESEHEMPDEWSCISWQNNGGYANRRQENDNRYRERIWFSPHCVKPNVSSDISDILAELKGAV